MTEGRISDEIRLALSAAGVWTSRNNIGYDERTRVRFGVGGPGSSDLVGVFEGRALFIEVKTPQGKLRPEQILFRNMIERYGAIYVVLRSKEEAIAWVATLKGEQPWQ